MSRTRKIRTQCPYCGVGCGLIAQVDGGRLTKVSGDPLHPVNRGATCQKPTQLPDAVHAADRATTVLTRASLDARLEASSWKQELPRLAEQLKQISAQHGPDAIAFYISGQLLTEDYYAVNKLVKGFLGTNNLDSNSRLCMSSAVAGYAGALGSDGPPASYADIEQTDCLLLLGTNTAACHPIVWGRIRRRLAEGAKLIVIDPRRTATAEAADLHLPVRPGTDLALLSALLHVLDVEDLIDRKFVARHTDGFEDALDVARDWPPQRAAAVTGVPAELIEAAARTFGDARRAMALWSMGANQSMVGTLKNRGLINLCLATGNIGRVGSGPLSLTGQPNAMGGRETGGLAHLLPGYRSVAEAADRVELRRRWQIPSELPGISPTPGLPATELVEALETGRVKAVWIVATNPVVSQPDAARFTAALRRAELVVVQDAYQPTETAACAHVVLPAAAWPEKDGTMTNSERRVGLLRKALPAPGDALPDWEIFARLGRALGFERQFAWRSADEVHAEYVATTEGRLCDQTGMSHARLRREGPLQWPIPARGVDGECHDGTTRLYSSNRFATENGRARFAPTPHPGSAEPVSDEFPLILTTGRVASQWHTMTRTGKSPTLLATEPVPFIELHPDDAACCSVRDGEHATVRSRRGTVQLLVRVTDTIARGVAFAPFHWGALHAAPGTGTVNTVTLRALDPISKQPELKACAVRVEPIRAAVRPRSTRRGRRVLVVGTGMAAATTVEAALTHGAQLDITMVGREPDLPYNRILLSQLLAGDVSAPELALHQRDWWTDHGVQLRLGTTVEAIDLDARRARLSDGDPFGFDALVLATGSRPWVPPVRGVHTAGVFTFRSLADCRAILDASRSTHHAVVVGGGLLGLEAARGLAAHGVKVTVIHLADRLMELQLDPLAGKLLARAVNALGITVRCGERTEAIVGEQSVTGVQLAGGEVLPADLVLFATGVAPDTRLAQAAGLDCGRGVIVDDTLRASAPDVWAVGECAEHRGRTYGLWAPLLAQSRVAGAALAGQPGAFLGAVPATTLKVADIDLFCAGRASASADEEEVLALDSRHGSYRKLVLDGDRLIGATLLGDLGDAQALRNALATGAPLPDHLIETTPGTTTPVAADPDDLLCTCNVVTHGEVAHAIRDRGLDTVAQVAEHTRASTGCGGCRASVRAVLDRLKSERREPLAAGAPHRA